MFWFYTCSEILNLYRKFNVFTSAVNLNKLYNTNMTRFSMKTLLELKSKTYNYFSKPKLHIFTGYAINSQKRTAPVF